MSSETTIDVDIELPPRQQLEMMSNPQHEAFWSTEISTHASVPTKSDTAYTKLLCWGCGIGEVLGKVVCGSHDIFFCLECQEDCGLGGKENCPKFLTSGELFKPEARCGCFCKLFFCKMALTNPLDKPFVVFNQKDVA